jgi:hypothetical protein
MKPRSSVALEVALVGVGEGRPSVQGKTSPPNGEGLATLADGVGSGLSEGAGLTLAPGSGVTSGAWVGVRVGATVGLALGLGLGLGVGGTVGEGGALGVGLGWAARTTAGARRATPGCCWSGQRAGRFSSSRALSSAVKNNASSRGRIGDRRICRKRDRGR